MMLETQRQIHMLLVSILSDNDMFIIHQPCMHSVTSDVQSVTATVVGESTIDIQCLFIHGSDAVGCKVVLVSGHPRVNNETKTLSRKTKSSSTQLKLTHQVDCYQRVLAYSISVNNSTSNFKIVELLNFSTNSVCTGKK